MARGTYGFAEVPFVFDELHVMTHDPDAATYSGTVISAAGPQRMGFTGETHNPEAEVGGTTFRYATLLRRYNVTLELLGVDIQLHKVITGGTEELNTAADQRNFFIEVGGSGGLPWFGALGFGATDDGGAFAVAVPQVKLSNVPGFDLTGNTVEYSTGSIDGMALPSRIRGVSGRRYAVAIRLYDKLGDLVIPDSPDTFKAFFTNDLNSFPGAPATPTSSAQTTTSITVNWVAPTQTGGTGLVITGYDVRYRVMGATDYTVVAGLATTPRNYSITGLTSGTTYEISVRALNIYGPGAWSAVLTQATS